MKHFGVQDPDFNKQLWREVLIGAINDLKTKEFKGDAIRRIFKDDANRINSFGYVCNTLDLCAASVRTALRSRLDS